MTFKLVPLQQWICDTCNQVIEKPEDGWFQISRDSEKKITDLHIVHNLNVSPIHRKEGCYAPDYDGDLPLNTVLGADGLSYLMTFLDRGEQNESVATPQMHEDHFRVWTYVVHRLHTPGFEQSRQFHYEAIGRKIVGMHPAELYTQATINDFIDQLT